MDGWNGFKAFMFPTVLHNFRITPSKWNGCEKNIMGTITKRGTKAFLNLVCCKCSSVASLS